jgi:hypothetical protein
MKQIFWHLIMEKKMDEFTLNKLSFFFLTIPRVPSFCVLLGLPPRGKYSSSSVILSQTRIQVNQQKQKTK